MRAPGDKVKQYFEIHTIGMNSPSRLGGSTGSENFCLNVFLSAPPGEHCIICIQKWSQLSAVQIFDVQFSRFSHKVFMILCMYVVML